MAKKKLLLITFLFLFSCNRDTNTKNNENTGPPPVSPTNVSATVKNDQVLINWDKVDSATVYNIYWSTNPDVNINNGTKITCAFSPYNHTPPASGANYYYVITASNKWGEGNESDRVSALLNKQPIALLSGPTSALKNAPVNFDASNSADPDGSITSYRMDFGDGHQTTQNTPFFSHSYESIGNFSPSLTVIDSLGGIQSMTSHLTIGISLSKPVNISNTSTFSQWETFTIGPNGHIHVFWIENGNIYYSRSIDKGETFGVPTILLPYQYGYQHFYLVSAATTNAVHLSWTVYSHGPAEIFYIRSTDDGNNFTSPTIISNGDGVISYISSITTDSDNRVCIAWTDYCNSIELSISDDEGKTFSTPQQVVSGLYASLPSIVLTPGTIYASWVDSVDNKEDVSDVFFALSTDGGSSFTTPINISQNPEKSWEPIIAIDSAGVLYIAWIEGTAFHNRKILFVSSPDGGQTFSTIKTLSDPGIDSFNLSLAIDPENRIYVTWSSSDDYQETMNSYFVSSSDGGKTFSFVFNLPFPGHIKANGSNQISLIWHEIIDGIPTFPDIFISNIKVSVP